MHRFVPGGGVSMILLIRRRWATGTTVFLLVLISLLSLLARPSAAIVLSHGAALTQEVIVLDAGHGGADGGAVSADGTAESGINLDITLRLRDFFSLMGCRVILTRTNAASLADPDSETLRQEKVSDTRNRVALINSVANARLISIHQNTLPNHPEVHGAQTFYGSVTGSESYGLSVQQALNDAININNTKHAKPIGGNIYIMAHAECPAILVECGFLSSSAETERLLLPEYQTKLAVSIGCGYLQCQQA